MKPRFLFAIAVVSIGIVLYPTSGVAGQKTVILIEGPRERVNMNRLRDAVQAHMSDLDTKVYLKTVVDMPEDLETRKDTARALLQETGASAAVWIEYNSDSLMLLVSDRGTEQILAQSFPGRLDDKEQILDAAAAVIRSALTPWFAADEPMSIPPPKEQAQKKEHKKSEDAVQEHRTRSPSLPRGALFAGYTLAVNFDASPRSGGIIGADAAVVRFLKLGIDFRLLQAASMNVANHNIRLFRMLPSPFAGFCPTFGAAAICLKAKITFDIARVLGANETEAPDPIRRTRIGFSASLFLRVRILPWMGIDLEIGTDVFGEPYHYRWDGEVVFTNGQIQPTASLSLSFLFPVSRKELRR